MNHASIVAICLTLVTAPGAAEPLGYHEIRKDAAGYLLPWNATTPAEAYGDIVARVWGFWREMGNCSNGVPYFFQHQVWKPEHDPRGLGGDQFAMALSSLSLLYGYSGDPAARHMMIRIADYALGHGFSHPQDAWPNLPYPYNTSLHSGIYDGDMRAGKGFLQPDKAGSLGIELLTLFEMTGDKRYLTAARKIADTLAAKVVPGDAEHSPWPFRVHAHTGEMATKAVGTYCANWTGTLRLFSELRRIKQGNTAAYARAFGMASEWLKRYPLRNNQWGPFFEDVAQWSNTEINADTMAWYLLEHPDWDAGVLHSARAILDWSQATFGTNAWEKVGVIAIREQTAYLVPGNSHTARHASVELLYCEQAADLTTKAAAIRQLNWATYMVDEDGKNRYPNDDIWLTDGYGDYMRHYLRAMAVAPELAPANQDHLLRTSSAIREIQYRPGAIKYQTFDAPSCERFRVSFLPRVVTVNGKPIPRVDRKAALNQKEAYYFEEQGPAKGWLEIQHTHKGTVMVRAS